MDARVNSSFPLGLVTTSGPGCPLVVPALSQRAEHLSVRRGVPGDLAWIDQMQRIHAGKLGFLWAKAIQKRLEQGNVLVAVDTTGCQHGFVMWGESYSGRDDVAVCFQLAVAPAFFRRLIGASLIAGWIAALPHGIRLVACWCAQDLPANHFWEAMGFNPLAWRTGSRGKQRPHIWWVRRTRQGDTFPLWFPAKTQGGAIGEERLVVPILPGQNWGDPIPTLMPVGKDETMTAAGLPSLEQSRIEQVENAAGVGAQRRQLAVAGKPAPADEPRPVITAQGIRFIGGAKPPPPNRRGQKAKVKRVTDPELRRKCRDLRDRYLDALHSGQLALPTNGKYEVGRLVDPSRLLDGLTHNRPPTMLPAASEPISPTGAPPS